MSRLALLGGEPAFPDGVAFARPAVPPLELVMRRLSPSYERGILTNGPLVRELEYAAAERLDVEHAVAVASCTSGLMLALRALQLTGAVLMPSFTFSASAHAVAWNGLRPAFAECDPLSFQLDLDDASSRSDGIGAVMATHVFGAPCRPMEVERMAAEMKVPVVFDAAHAFGARCAGQPVGGFGDVEVFSLSPTKPLIAGEGGLIATDNEDLAEFVRIGRDYGNPGDYDTRFVGLNARMSEMHAALALESMQTLEERLETRRGLADRYVDQLAGIAGLRAQQVDAQDVSTWKDITIAVDEAKYGVDRDAVVAVLRADGVDTRCYFDPPIHLQQSHRGSERAHLPVTERLAAEVLSLPVYPDLPSAVVDRIVELLELTRQHAEEIGDSVA